MREKPPPAPLGPDSEPGTSPEIDRLRRRILECDRELVRVLGRRRDLAREIGRAKASLGLQVTDPQREAVVVRRAARLARDAGLDEELVREIIWRVMASARDEQNPRRANETDAPPKAAPPSAPRSSRSTANYSG